MRHHTGPLNYSEQKGYLNILIGYAWGVYVRKREGGFPPITSDSYKGN